MGGLELLVQQRDIWAGVLSMLYQMN